MLVQNTSNLIESLLLNNCSSVCCSLSWHKSIFYQPCVAVVSAPVTSPGVGLDMELDGLTENDLIFVCCFCMIAWYCWTFCWSFPMSLNRGRKNQQCESHVFSALMTTYLQLQENNYARKIISPGLLNSSLFVRDRELTWKITYWWHSQGIH